MNEILNISKEGAKKTHVMYRANLSHSQLEKYLGILMDKKLLGIDDGLYVITEKGKEFVKKFVEIQSILEESSPTKVSWRNSI
jgi:predicted transcriptional regulator